PTLTAMLKAQRRTKDLEARKRLIVEFQRYAAEQQYYVYLTSGMITGTWQPYVKNFAPNMSFDYGGRAAALWADREGRGAGAAGRCLGKRGGARRAWGPREGA